MTNELDINITAIQSHRNGVSGNHFYSVFFSFTEDGKSHDLIAVITSGYGNCFVVSKKDPEMCWRGDHFESELKEAVAQWVSKKWNTPVERIRKELECEDENDQGKVVSPDMRAFIKKEHKELTDHLHDATKAKDSGSIWYYSGALMEMAYLKDFVGYEEEIPASKSLPTINPEELEIH
jgi:hypothetical protein